MTRAHTYLAAAAAIAVTAAFFLFLRYGLWAAADAAGIVAACYAAGATIYALRKPAAPAVRIAAALVFLAAAAGTGWYRYETYAVTHWQKEQMERIRESVSRGVMSNELVPILQGVIREYYGGRRTPGESLGDVFYRLYPQFAAERNLAGPATGADSLRIYLSFISQSKIVLVGQVVEVPGSSAAFRNYDGRSGMVQGRATLTAEGVRYESEN